MLSQAKEKCLRDDGEKGWGQNTLQAGRSRAGGSINAYS